MNISFPSYRRQKDKRGDRAFIVINARRFYLGLYNSAESQQQYKRLMAEWLAGNGDLPPESDQLTIAQFINRFWKHVKVDYRQSDGNLSSEAHNYRALLRILRELYGDQLVDEFKPVSLRTCARRVPWVSGVCVAYPCDFKKRTRVNGKIVPLTHATRVNQLLTHALKACGQRPRSTNA